MSIRQTAALAAAVAFLLPSAAVQAQGAASWPSKTVHWVIPYAPGGPTDVVSRVIAPKFSERIGQPVIIENRPGAAGNVGTDMVSKAVPDGHTLLYVVPAVIMNPYFFKSSPDPKSLAPVIQLLNYSMVLLASANFAPKTVAEILALAKSRPGSVSCGSAGGVPTVACELLRAGAKTEMIMVMYKGQGPAMNALMGGEINLLFDGVGTAMQPVRSGRVRPIATVSAKPGSGAFANLPTMAETIPGFELTVWHGLMTPAATPLELRQKVNRELAAVLATPEVRKRVTDSGFDVSGGPVEEFEDTLRRESIKYGQVLRDAGVKPE